MVKWLREGTFRPGSKLPSQNELIEQFRVSRTGIREALQMMAALNLIEIRQGLGCFVKGISPEFVINADVLAILLEKEAILEVMETRRLVESSIAALATERAKIEDFWRMEDVLTQLDRAVHRGDSVATLAAEFHFALALGAHNAVLAKLVRSFSHLMSQAGELLEKAYPDLERFKQHELESHRKLYEVIRQRDPEKSRQAMVDHISFSESLVIKAFKQAEENRTFSVDEIPALESPGEFGSAARPSHALGRKHKPS